MELIPVDAADAPAPEGGYTNAMGVVGATRWLYVSGQIPQTAGGTVPTGIEDQCRLVWANLSAQLDAFALTVANLVKVTTYLSDRSHAEANTLVRNEMLGAHRPALTVIVAEIWDPAWLIEIEAVAAA